MSIGQRTIVAFSSISLALMAACTQYVDVPDVDLRGPEPVAEADRQAVLDAIIPTPTIGATEFVRLPVPRRSVHLPRVGEELSYGLPVTAEMEKLWQASLDKDWAYWEALLDEAAASLPNTPEAEFVLASQRIKTMIHGGRTDDVFREIARLEKIESALFGDNIETLSQYGQVNFWLNRPDEALGYYSRVLRETGDWWLPTFYYAPPENTGNAKRLAGAMLRAYVGMSGTHVMKKDYAAAMAWGELGLDRAMDIVGISHNPIYGIFVETTAYMYEGMAWNLTFYAAARIGVSKDIAANQHLIDAAKAFFDQSGYLWGDIVVDSVVDFVLFDVGLKPRETNAIGPLSEPDYADGAALKAALRVRPGDLIAREDMNLPAPAPGSIQVPGANETNAFGFLVSDALDLANGAYLEGDYNKARATYEAIAEAESDPLKKWHASTQVIKTMIASGQSAKALERLEGNALLEEAFFGTNINARSLRGDAKFWLGDYDGSVADFAQVAAALGDFRAPTLFVFPPQIPHLSLLNRTQFRTYLGVARSLMFKGDYEAALPWAEAAEQLFEETHYSWQHQLYSAYLKIDADMFNSRGVNLAVIGAARLVLDKGADRSEEMFASAKSYLEALNYKAGLTTVDAIQARALLDAGKPGDAAVVAKRAAIFAAQNGHADLLWQIEALRGDALATLGQHREAERAFRNAQDAVDAVSGALASDSSKRQFGIGKEEITRRLANYDIARGDFADAFRDLERGRARAFVDMIAQVRVAGNDNAGAVAAIQSLSTEIRSARVSSSAPGRDGTLERKRIATLMKQRNAKVAALRRRDPELAGALSIDIATLASVQRRLNHGDVLAYALPVQSDENIRFLLIDRTHTRIFETDLTDDALGTALTPFSTDDPLRTAQAQVDAADRVYGGLGLDEWAPSGVTYVVPSGHLYFTPWGALPISSPVVVLPTGGWLTRQTSRRRRAGAALVGDPDLGKEWAALPGAKQEAEDLAKLFKSPALTGDKATIKALRTAVGSGVKILHLATHGIFDGREPLNSAILLSGDGAPERLTAADLFENPLPADLVIMSACDTGLGHVAAGNDFLGLARSFYLGGTHAVVNSLWPVHDKPTQAFMRVFHQELDNSNDLGNAWLAAREHLREQGLPPSIYGAFVLGGAAKL